MDAMTHRKTRKRTWISAGVLALCLLAIPPQDARGQQVRAEVMVHLEALPVLHREQMADFGLTLVDYIEEWDWLEEDLPEPVHVGIEAILAFMGSAVKTQYGSRLTVYSGTDLKYLDRWWFFEYEREDLLQHDDQQFNALTGLIDYYVHIMIGHALDKYTEFGGQRHFQRANAIALDGRFSRDFQRGWDERLDLIDGILAEDYKPYRLIRNRYYRGLAAQKDNKLVEARTLCREAVDLMAEIHGKNPRDKWLSEFLNAHYLQLADVFSANHPPKCPMRSLPLKSTTYSSRSIPRTGRLTKSMLGRWEDEAAVRTASYRTGPRYSGPFHGPFIPRGGTSRTARTRRTGRTCFAETVYGRRKDTAICAACESCASPRSSFGRNGCSA